MTHQKPRRNPRQLSLYSSHCGSIQTGRPLEDLQRYHEVKKSLQRTENYAAVKELFKDRNLEDLCKYLTAQKANASSYADYVKACVYLGLDMSLERNLLPRDFDAGTISVLTNIALQRLSKTGKSVKSCTPVLPRLPTNILACSTTNGVRLWLLSPNLLPN